jgi:hypothetical protein
MKKILLIIAALLFLPAVTLAATYTVPWNTTNLTNIQPNVVNGVTQGFLVSASSTVNGNFSVSGLTSGDCVQAGTGGLLTSASGACGSGGGGTTFGYPFPGNATSTNINFSGGLTGTLTGSITGNAGTVTNGVYTTGAGSVYLTPTGSAALLTGFPTFNQNTTGNAGTATALAANGTNCSAGSYALGVDATGNAEGCTSTAGFSTFGYLFPGNATTTNITFTNGLTGALTGNASTVTNGVYTTRNINTTSPLQGGGDLSADRTFSILQSGTSQNGYLSSTDWNTFNGKQAAISLTTSGSSGAATLVGSTLNIPQYTGGGGGGSPGGSSTQIQYNSSGSFAGASGLTTDGTNLGIGSTTPIASLSLGAGTSVTSSWLTLATSTTMSVGIASSTNQVIYYSTAAITLNVSNYHLYSGTQDTIKTCGPAVGTAGAITWANLHYSGGVQPGNSTIPGQCDNWYISVEPGPLGSTTPWAVLTGQVSGLQ